ncbi:LytR/AlgR family response regulator transcription factor [Flagellimonas taeanensis]|nr:LytTR family DNA-binding domain-containing protein [Allomuricauda taeanensis]
MTNVLKCIAVDDEPIALKLIEGYISKTPFLKLERSFTNAIEALGFFNNHPVELLFLDIQMPDLSGLELSKIVKEKTKVIFTTAFNQYALDGFRVDAVDYLLKPFDYVEFLEASQKAYNRIFTENTKFKNIPASDSKDFLYVKSGYKQLKVSLDSILYIEGLKDYVKILLKDNPKPILTLMSLKILEQELPSSRFMRVNRSYIVALHHIEEIERNLILIDKTQITISEQHKAKFQEYLNRNSI